MWYGIDMTQLMEDAVRAMKRLPADEQDEIARMVLDIIDADAKWDRLFADPRSEAVLVELAAEAEREVAEGHVYDCDSSNRPKGR